MTELYQDKHSLDYRIDRVNKIKQKHPGMIPIVLQKARNNKSHVPNTTVFALTQPQEQIRTLKQFLWKKLNIPINEELFMYSDRRLLQMDTTIQEIYQKQNSPDGMLYIDYTGWDWTG